MLFPWLKNLFEKFLYTDKIVVNDESIRYQLLENFRSHQGEHIIVAKLIDNPRNVFKLPVSELINNRKDLLKQFSSDDIVNIVGIATMAGKFEVIVYSGR